MEQLYNTKNKKSAGEKIGALVKLYKKEHLTDQQAKAKDKEIEKELKSIYRDNKGNMPNLTKLDFKPHNRTRNIIIAVIGVLFIFLAAAVSGFFIFQPKPKFSGDKINIEIKAPFQVSSGDKVNYQIKITNNEAVSLTNVKLTVNLPIGYVYTNANKQPQDSLTQDNSASNIKTWLIGDLYMEQSQIININGNLIGQLNSKLIVAATISYIPANFSSEFQKNTSFTTEISDSLLALDTESSAQVANSEPTEIKLRISNKSAEIPITNIQIEVNFPGDFALYDTQILAKDEAVKKVTIDKNSKNEPSPKLIALPSLMPLEEKKIVLTGKFNVDESKTVSINILSKLKGPVDEYFTQKENKLDFEIIKGDLITNIIIQGSNQNRAVNFGDTLSYLLTIENKSKKNLGDIKVRAVLNSTFLDWKTLTDQNKGVQEDDQILWTQEQIPDLANLLPEEEVEIPFQIKLKNLQDVKNYKPEELLLKSFFETQINKINNTDTEITNESNTIINEFNTNLTLQSSARYFGDNSETLGSGPLPPIVGQTTTYKIFWKLNNSLHEISNIEVKTKLPTNINFEDKNNISTGNIFKNQDNEIIWQISRIPASVNEATAEFEISLTPKPEDVSKILTLLQDIKLTATDAQTKGQIYLTVHGITTNLDSDPLGKGKGLIQSE